MSYEGEYASYRPLNRIAESERVQQLLKRARVFHSDAEGVNSPDPVDVPPYEEDLPEFVIAIDGSNAEVPVKNGFPGAKVGYCTVASVLLNLQLLDSLDENRPIDPVDFRKTEEASTIDAALPGSNVVIRDHVTARDSFRETVYDVFHDVVIDSEDQSSLMDTFEALLALKPNASPPTCPYSYDGCQESFSPPPGLTSCHCPKRRVIYSTDALRIHERFRDLGSNGEALGEVMQVWERILLIHLLRCFESRGWLGRLNRLAFVVDGPLALFGHPAWLSAAISTELKRLNLLVLAESGQDLLLIGVEKTGAFVSHFEEVDETETPGERLFRPRSVYLLTDRYIKTRIAYSTSSKRYGADTYFGRKLFYKTTSGARLVVSIPFLRDEHDNLESEDPAQYPALAPSLALLDRLVSSRFGNALAPVVSAHAQAAIPLHLGSKVLQQLAHALMREE